MREIKFRAWDIEQPCMMSYEEIINEWENEGFYDSMFRQDHWHCMLCTGMKDKNGKEVYDGDIVIQPSGTYIVNSCAGGFDCTDIKDNGCYIFACLCECYCEVIGNIYENPELLNAKQ